MVLVTMDLKAGTAILSNNNSNNNNNNTPTMAEVMMSENEMIEEDMIAEVEAALEAGAGVVHVVVAVQLRIKVEDDAITMHKEGEFVCDDL